MAVRSVGQHHGDLRTAIIDAALSALDADRESEISIRALARSIEVSPSAIYHHFADRSALLDALAHLGFERLGHMQAEVAATSSDAHLFDLIGGYIEFATDDAGLYRVMFSALDDSDSGASPATRVAAAATFDELSRVVERTNSTLDRATARQRALMIWTLTHGVIELGPWTHHLDESFTRRRITEQAARSAVSIAAAPANQSAQCDPKAQTDVRSSSA